MGPTARDPALLTEVEGKVGRGHDKDDSLCGGTLSAAATRNLFRKKQDFIHNGRGCEERGHILKEAPLSVHSSWFLKFICMDKVQHVLFPLLGWSVTDWIKDGFPGYPRFLGE